jgi:hypothetical protein
LAVIFPSWWNDESSLVVIDLGIDESGKSGDKLIVSALLGQTALMAKMKSKWSKDIGVAGVDFFHAKEHWNKKSKAYHGLSMTKRKSLLKSLAPHIGKYAGLSIGVEIDLRDFEARATPRFKNTFGSAYAFGIHLMLVVLRLHLEAKKATHEGINILIEEGHKNSRQAIDQIVSWKSRPGTVLKITSEGLGNKRDNPILQAADMVAYGWWQFKSTKDKRIFRAVKHSSPRLMAAFLPWSPRCIEAVKEGVDLHRQLRQDGTSTKAFGDLAIW